MASNSAWLFYILKLMWSEFSMTISFGSSRTMPTLAPFRFEESSTYKVHQPSSVGCSPCRSVVKLARHCAFIEPRRSY